MQTYYVRVRFTAVSAYYPAIIAFTSSDFRTANEFLFSFISGFELGHPLRISLEEISINKPRGIAPSIIIGTGLSDPGLERFLQENK